MLFNGKYYNKPGHLGMTRAQVKDALQGAASNNSYTQGGPLNIELTALQIVSILSGSAVSDIDVIGISYSESAPIISTIILGTDLVTPMFAHIVGVDFTGGQHVYEYNLIRVFSGNKYLVSVRIDGDTMKAAIWAESL